MERLFPDSLRIEKHETIYGVFYCWAGDLITEQLRKYSAHTRNELAMVRSFIKDGDNILDIGAHIGTFSIPLARFNHGNGKIFSFEANPANYQLLEKNILENRLDGVVFPIRAVVSQTETGFSMKLPPNGNSGMYYFEPMARADERRSTTTVKIDDWYEENISGLRIDFIKVDVEGAELSVLSSCEHIIKTFHPALYIEINSAALRRFNSSPNDIDVLLKQHGYRFFRNVAERNSANDNFTIAHLDSLSQGGEFFDVVALDASSSHRAIL